MTDTPFWILKSIVALERTSKWTETRNKNVPNFSKQGPSNQCISSFWMNTELCLALWPLANEWNHDDCNENKYFICEGIPKKGS